MRRYDYYPFGMEIMSRSGDFSQVDYSSDVYELLYEGLLKSCDAYDTVDVSVSTADSIHCVTANNIYGQAYVDTIFLDHYKETQAWSGMHKFEFSVDMKLSEVIPDLDSAGSYLIEFDFESQGRFITCETPWSGVQSSPGVTTSSDIRRAETKSLAISFKGNQLDSLAMNGAVYFKFKASWAESGHPYDTYAKITNIKVTQIFNNTSTPLAMRDGSAYTYGFNGKLRDDEISGSGNSYDFGARMYNPRLGRWFAPDPYEKLYAPISPYAFALNSPIKLKDADGNVVVDENGNPVTITPTKNEDGSYSASYSFAEGTSQAVKDNFLNGGAKIIKAMLEVPTGQEMVAEAVLSSELIHYKLNPGKNPNKNLSGNEEGNTHFQSKWIRDEDGNRVKFVTYIQIDIYEEEIENSSMLREGEVKLTDQEKANRSNNLDQNQRVGATGVHETWHATDKDDVDALYKNKQIDDQQHKGAENKEMDAIKEYGKKNK